MFHIFGLNGYGHIFPITKHAKSLLIFLSLGLLKSFKISIFQKEVVDSTG